MSLRIAMIGQKGLPATFGGVERHVEEVGSRLAARGHEVVVFSRTTYAPERLREYRGMRVRNLPTVRRKHLDAIVHSALATVVATLGRFDIIHYHAVGPGIPALLPRLAAGAKVVLTVHGLDAERAKWGTAARAVLRTAEWLSALVPDATVVVSRSLADHYRIRYGRATHYIPNGVEEPTPRPPGEALRRLGLEGRPYLLFVGRLVPEKAPDLLIRAFRGVPGDIRLVLAGGSSFTDDYVRSLQKLAAADPRVVLAGYVHGAALEELYSNATAFVLPSLLEGLPLTLLEAASYGTPVVVSDIPPHVEVVGEEAPGRRVVPAGDQEALASALAVVIASPARERQGARGLREEVLSTYRWEDTARATEELYLRLVAR